MKKKSASAKLPVSATKSGSRKTSNAPVATKSKARALKTAKKLALKPARAVAPAGVKSAVKTREKPASQAAVKPAVKPVAPVLVMTTITATIDVGFGNALYLRGEGASLSWDRGVRMHCVANDCWSLALHETARPLLYKFLVNDLTWSAGEDYTAPAGKSVTVVPTFP